MMGRLTNATILKENKLHERNFQITQETLIPIVIKLNKETEVNIGGIQQHNYNELHGSLMFNFDDERILSVRYIKIPTFTINNRLQYHLIAFCNLPEYYSDDLREIRSIILDRIPHKQTMIDGPHGPSYTIFLAGKQRGRTPILTLNTIARSCNTYHINTIQSKDGKRRSPSEVRANIFRTLSHLFEGRLHMMIEKINSGHRYLQGKQIHNTIHGVLNKQYNMLVHLKEQLFKTYAFFNRIHHLNLLKQKQDSNQFSNILENRLSQEKKSINQYIKLVNNVEKMIQDREIKQKEAVKYGIEMV